MPGLCHEKVILVTGGGRGIGRSISVQLAVEGARVMLADVLDEDTRETVETIRNADGEADWVHCDVTNANQVQATVDATVAKFGRIDCLVNNAGIGITGPFTEAKESDFDRITAINLKGSFLFLRSVVSQILTQGNGGSIVNIASVGGVVGTPEYALYAMTKHGVIGLTKCLALEYAAAGIRVNAVCPGPIRTDMIEQTARKKGYSSVDDLAIDQGVPLGRLGRPEEVAEAVIWLCSDRASNTTGSNLFTDGGYTAQ